ncbi:MAG: PTS sugar transporter subunit IIA, partial [Lachnospiraceae bacterium]|nr:PTS sugar transporter subunit IIA [Lachnospiraceae bacterium]
MSIAFDQSLILRIENAKTNTEVLTRMCEHLCEKEIVKDTYCEAILER